MKTFISLFLTFSLYLTGMDLHAQGGKGLPSPVPLKQPNSVSYGNDIIINNYPAEDQRNVHISAAFNGWLYAVYTHNTTLGTAGFTVFRSIDNGNTWSMLQDYNYSGAYTAMDILVAGNNLADLKLFVAGVYNASVNDWRVFCDRVDPQTGTFEDEFLYETSANQIYDVALASDYAYPNSSSPYSIGIVYTKFSNPLDSALILVSNDGGMTIGSRSLVTASSEYLHNIAISYGRGMSWDLGRYFVAWEENAYNGAPYGHILTGYTDPFPVSPVMHKIMLDSLDAASFNVCRLPSISTQCNNVDNINGNITEIVLYDKYNSSGANYDIKGNYNLQALGSGIAGWQNMDVAATPKNEIESDITFDPVNNMFQVTYFNDNDLALPSLENGMNLPQPDNWTIMRANYNDSYNLHDAVPKLKMDPLFNQVVNVWNAEGTGGDGVSMFDAEYNTNTGISGNSQSDQAILSGAFPNPAKTRSTIEFTLNRPAEVTVTMNSIFGQKLNVLTDASYDSGKHNLDVDVSTLPTGTYVYHFTAGNYTASGRIVVIRYADR
jgi:hypothetical protein